MTDAMADEPTIGEIGRSVVRIEDNVKKLADQVQTAIAPVSELKTRMQRVEDDVKELDGKVDRVDGKVDAVKSRADRASGGLAVMAVITSMIPWPWKK